MNLRILVANEINVYDKYINENDSRIIEWELEDCDIGTYIIGGVNFTSLEKEKQVNDNISSNNVSIIVNHDIEAVFRDYDKNEWSKMVMNFIKDNKNRYSSYIAYTDSFIF